MKKILKAVAGAIVVAVGTGSCTGGLKGQLPIQLDENTVVTDIKSEEHLTTYMMRLDGLDYDVIDLEKIKESRRIGAVFRACQSIFINEYILNETDLRYIFSSSDGRPLFDYQISKNDCLPFKSGNSDAIVNHYVDLLKEILPMTLEDSTMNFIDIKQESNAIEFVFQFRDPFQEALLEEVIDPEEIENLLAESLLEDNCTNPVAKILFERGFSIKATYLDKTGKVVFSGQTTRAMCKAL